MSNSQITIEATVAASPAKVWAYWTDPKHITKWNFAIPEWHCPKATNDLKVGGKYSARMVTVFDAEKQNPEDMQRSGWQSILNNFKSYTEQN